jgi:hypothetical protein
MLLLWRALGAGFCVEYRYQKKVRGRWGKSSVGREDPGMLLGSGPRLKPLGYIGNLLNVN